MTPKRSTTPTRRGRVAWLAASAVLLAVLAGCAESKKSGTAPTAARQPTEKTQTAKPTPAPIAAKSSPTAQSPDKPQKAESPPAQKTEPPKAKPGADQPTQKVDFSAPQDGKPMSPAERDELAEKIKAAVIAGQKEQADKPASTPKPAAPPARPKPPTPPSPADRGPPQQKPAADKPAGDASADAQKKDGGCGAAGAQTVDLTPPAEGQPQPKLAVKEKKVTSEGIWQGKAADFTFELTNEGEGPLAIRIKKG